MNERDKESQNVLRREIFSFDTGTDEMQIVPRRMYSYYIRFNRPQFSDKMQSYSGKKNMHKIEEKSRMYI